MYFQSQLTVRIVSGSMLPFLNALHKIALTGEQGKRGPEVGECSEPGSKRNRRRFWVEKESGEERGVLLRAVLS